MSVGSSASLDAAARALVLRHVSSLITKAQAFFEQRQDEQLKVLRSHLYHLVDSRPHLTETQNRRTAAMLLDKHGALFNRSFQIALREALEEEFEAVMPGALAALRPVESSHDTSGPASMALLDVDEIERHLLVDRVAQRFNVRYEAGLAPLTQCLGVMLRLQDFSLSDNPFRPATVVRAFSAAWHMSEFEPEAAEDFVLALDPAHGVDWAPLYASLSETLVRAGFSAKQAHRIKRSVGGDSGPAPLQGKSSFGPTEQASLRSGYASLESERARSTLGEPGSAGRGIAVRAKQFLQKLGFGRAAPGIGADEGGSSGIGWAGAETAGGVPTQAPHVPADPALMGFLGGLLAKARALPVRPWVEGQDFGDQNLLRQMRESEEVQRAPELDRGTIDALAEVFDYVFADRSIPTQLKVVIGRLQIPVLKAAMMDRDFFLSNEHPARKLVDALASASVGWTAEKGEDDPLYVRIETTVKRVLTEFEDDLGLFGQLLTEFNAYLQETEQQVQVRIDPAARQEQSGEALEFARSHADDVVHQCIGALPRGEPLAPFLLPFLANQWREVMARAWMNAAGEPAQWDDVLATMDQVIWSTQPKANSGERAKLVAMLPELVRKLNTSLDAIGWAGDERATFTRLLIDTHMKAIRVAKNAPAPTEVGPSEVEAKAGRDALKALEERRASQAPEQNDAFDAQAQGFERGMWFEFADDQGQRRRYRLSWVSPQRTRMLFTNRDGFEAFVRSEREVAGLLREGRLTVIDQQPIVTRAIEQIMSDAEKTELDLEIV